MRKMAVIIGAVALAVGLSAAPAQAKDSSWPYGHNSHSKDSSWPY
jgi:hypothetical protein